MSFSRLRARLKEALSTVHGPVSAWCDRWDAGRWAADLAALAAITWIYVVFVCAFTFAPIRWDEQFFLSEGFSVGQGLVPYRDFQEFKPPMIFVVNMLALKTFGLAGMKFRYFFAILTFSGFLMTAIALLSRRTPALIVFAVECLMINHFLDTSFLDSGVLDTSETIGLVFLLLSAGVLLLKTRRTRAQQLLGGALLALAPLSKEPFAFPAVFAWLTLLLLHQAESSDPLAWRRFVARTCLGALAVAVVWLGYMLVTRSLGWYLLQLRETMVYSAEHNEMYGVFPKLSFADAWAESWKRLDAHYVNAKYLTAFFPYFAGALLLWPRRSLAMSAAAVATFAGGVYGVTIGHGFFGHYFIIALTATLFLATFGAAAMAAWLPSAGLTTLRWTCLFLSASALYPIWPRFYRERQQWSHYQPPAAPVSQAMVQLVRRRTTATDRIWNVGMPGFYMFSDRLRASRIGYVHDSLLHMYPGKTDAEKLAPYRKELDISMPKLVILSEGRAGRERHMDVLVMPFLREHAYKLINERSEVPVYERPY